MNLKFLLRVWLLLSINFIGLVIVLISMVLINDWTIITKPLPTLVAISFVVLYGILLLSGSIILDKLRKRELEIS